jgi:hypothetical protein
MYVSRGSNVQVLASSTLRGVYKDQGTLARGVGVPCGPYDPATKRYWTFGHARVGEGTVIRRAVHARLDTPLGLEDWKTVISGAKFPGLGPQHDVESPGITSGSAH